MDYFIRNDYITYYDDIILVINKYDHLEYKKELNDLNCTIIRFGYSKKIDNGLDWVVHNNDMHYKGYNILIKDVDKSYSFIIKNNKINIIGIDKDTR